MAPENGEMNTPKASSRQNSSPELGPGDSPGDELCPSSRARSGEDEEAINTHKDESEELSSIHRRNRPIPTSEFTTNRPGDESKVHTSEIEQAIKDATTEEEENASDPVFFAARIPGEEQDESSRSFNSSEAEASRSSLKGNINFRRSSPAARSHRLLFDRQVSQWSSSLFPRLSKEVSCAKARVWEYYNPASLFFASDTAMALAHNGIHPVLLLGSRGGLLNAAHVATASDPSQDCQEPSYFSPKEDSSWDSTRPPLLFSSKPLNYPSMISDLKAPPGDNDHVIGIEFGQQHKHGTVLIYDLRTSRINSVEFDSSSSFGCQLWSLEVLPDSRTLSIGGGNFHYLVDLKTGSFKQKTFMRSAIYCQKLDSTGNLLMCGMKSGKVIPFDLRDESPSKTGFEMGSPVCSLTMLSDETFLLASSLQGSIYLWDQRKQDKPVRSFEGNFNSHTMLRMALDPTETLLLSGGEDCALRIWSFRTGKLLKTMSCFEHPTSTVQFVQEPEDYPWCAWLGSSDALYYVHGSF